MSLESCSKPRRKSQRYRVCQSGQWIVAEVPKDGGTGKLRFVREDNARTFVAHHRRGWASRAKAVAVKRLSKKPVR